MGYEQLDVAFLLGIKSHASISEWEQGITKPSLENLLQLSIIYRTLPDDLYPDLRRKFLKDIRERLRILQAQRDRGG